MGLLLDSEDGRKKEEIKQRQKWIFELPLPQVRDRLRSAPLAGFGYEKVLGKIQIEEEEDSIEVNE